MMTKPRNASLFFPKKLVIPYAWIHDRIEGVGQEVDEDITERDRENTALKQGVIPGIDRLNRQPPQPRPCENRFRNDRARQQCTSLKAKYRNNG